MTSVESLTKELRDFAYAVPEDVRDAALAVASDLAAERKRREGLEEELHLERLAHTAAVTRAERAEADNAALLRLLEEVLINVDSIQERRRYGEMAPELAVDVIREDLERHSQFGAALLERMRALERFTSAARDLEWQRHDWQGLCVFRRAAGCDGTDGRYSALGTPKPRPHSENCPFHGLNALEKAP